MVVKAEEGPEARIAQEEMGMMTSKL